MIALKAALWNTELACEGVQLVDRRITDEVTPESIVRRPNCSVDQDGHQLLNPARNRCSASLSTAGCLQNAQRT